MYTFLLNVKLSEHKSSDFHLRMPFFSVTHVSIFIYYWSLFVYFNYNLFVRLNNIQLQ